MVEIHDDLPLYVLMHLFYRIHRLFYQIDWSYKVNAPNTWENSDTYTTSFLKEPRSFVIPGPDKCINRAVILENILIDSIDEALLL